MRSRNGTLPVILLALSFLTMSSTIVLIQKSQSKALWQDKVRLVDYHLVSGEICSRIIEILSEFDIEVRSLPWREKDPLDVSVGSVAALVQAPGSDHRLAIEEAWFLLQGKVLALSSIQVRFADSPLVPLSGRLQRKVNELEPLSRAPGSSTETLQKWSRDAHIIVNQLQRAHAQRHDILRERIDRIEHENSRALLKFSITFSTMGIALTAWIALQLRFLIGRHLRSEEVAQNCARELKRKNIELDRFAMIASHDLQEPVRKIQLFGERLATRYRDDLPERAQDYLERMTSAARRMSRLIQEILVFSRAGRDDKPPEQFDLCDVVKEVCDDLAQAIQDSGGHVKIGRLPVVAANRSQILQLFANLISNAVKFRKTEEPLVVEIWSESEGSTGSRASGQSKRCRVFVRDNGIGFEEKYSEQIFGMFQRLHGRHEYEGTGVGLAICRKIVRGHDGELTVSSEFGRGATFVFSLPVSANKQELQT